MRGLRCTRAGAQRSSRDRFHLRAKFDSRTMAPTPVPIVFYSNQVDRRGTERLAGPLDIDYRHYDAPIARRRQWLHRPEWRLDQDLRRVQRADRRVRLTSTAATCPQDAAISLGQNLEPGAFRSITWQFSATELNGQAISFATIARTRRRLRRRTAVVNQLDYSVWRQNFRIDHGMLNADGNLERHRGCGATTLFGATILG